MSLVSVIRIKTSPPPAPALHALGMITNWRDRVTYKHGGIPSDVKDAVCLLDISAKGN